MKIAIITLPSRTEHHLPPLTMAYVAALLEQRRAIPRIYDCAIDSRWDEIDRRLQTFQPQRIIIAGEDADEIEQGVSRLHPTYADILPLRARRSGSDAFTAVNSILAWFDGTTMAPSPTTDELPYPARHLLSLERYTLRATGGEVQTPVVIGWRWHNQWLMRPPRLVGQEMRALSEEVGIRHILFHEPELTNDETWFNALLEHLIGAHLHVKWQASVSIERLSSEQIQRLAQAGCEALTFTLSAASEFDSANRRAQTRQLIARIREQGIYTRATVILEPPYEAISRMVDVAATFGLNDVAFTLMQNLHVGEEAQQIHDFARQRYAQRRARQRLIDRFGSVLGNLLWQLRAEHLADDE